MPHLTLRSITSLVLGLSLVTACAHRTAATGDPHPVVAHVRPPEMLTREQPDLEPALPMTNGRVLDIQLEVLVDSTGRAVPGTLRATGPGASQNADELERWLQDARFRPAEQGGQPVAGVYKSRIEMRVVTQRRS